MNLSQTLANFGGTNKKQHQLHQYLTSSQQQFASSQQQHKSLISPASLTMHHNHNLNHQHSNSGSSHTNSQHAPSQQFMSAFGIASSNNAAAASPPIPQHNHQTLLHHHHHQQQQLQQQQQQQLQQQQLPLHHPTSNLYNVNSDYSSSTYHIYDTVSDLAILNQQRLERKRQLAQRRKVILRVALAIVLVSSMFFLLLKALFPSATIVIEQQAPRTELSSSSNNVLLPPSSSSRISIIDQHNQLLAQQHRQHTLLQRQQQQQQQQFPSQQYLPPAAPAVNAFQSEQPSFVASNPQLQLQQQQQLQLQQQLQQQQAAVNQFAGFQVQLQQQQQQQQQQLSPSFTQANFLQSQLLAATSSQQQQLQQQQQQSTLSSSSTKTLQEHCNNRGVLINNACKCSDEFYGSKCEFSVVTNAAIKCQLTNCSGNGLCNASGQCQCFAGYIGEICDTFVSQPLVVTLTQQQESNIKTESTCSDQIDNDEDGLVDCLDSDCCSDNACVDSPLCMKSPDPLDTLMRKQAQVPTASFFQRMQFLLEKSSTQIYTNIKEFNDSLMSQTQVNRASVIRGRVIFNKQGVIGVKVSVVGQKPIGITVTRDGGYFDLMVNGGGALSLEFLREPFATLQLTIRVPWNEIVLIDAVELSLAKDVANGAIQTKVYSKTIADESNVGDEFNATPTCLMHNYKLMKPIIVAAPKSNTINGDSKKTTRFLNNNNNKAYNLQHQQSELSQSTTANNINSINLIDANYSRAVILKEIGMVKHSIELPATNNNNNNNKQSSMTNNNNNNLVSLVYVSGKSSEFMSTISFQLTPAVSPSSSLTHETANSQQSTTNFEAMKLIQELKYIHLKIIIEGNLAEQLFEPRANLTYTFAWNRQNVYRQKSYGVSIAFISIGYEYYNCKSIIWLKRQVSLQGHDLPVSQISNVKQPDVGNQWNLNVHHRYNYRDAILQRGDGSNFNLKLDKPKVVRTVIGDGVARSIALSSSVECAFCDPQTTAATSTTTAAAAAIDQRLLRPSSLVSAPDGSLYIGDANLIRKIEYSSAASGSGNNQRQAAEYGTRTARTILEMPHSSAPQSYSLALSAVDSRLYIANGDTRQVFMIRESPSTSSNSMSLIQRNSNNNNNFDIYSSTSSSSAFNDSIAVNSQQLFDESLVLIAGSGLKCALDDSQNCGDKGPAKLARLNNPKSLAFDLSNRMYIADGSNIRMVDTDANIYTILGDYSQSTARSLLKTQFPCQESIAIPMHKFDPKNPISLAINPLDETLHFLDDNVVYRVTQDKRVEIIAGKPAHCIQQSTAQTPTTSDALRINSSSSSSNNGSKSSLKASDVSLQFARQIAFAANGDLFVVEDDELQFISRVLLISADDSSVSLFVGLPPTSSSSSSSSAEPTSNRFNYQRKVNNNNNENDNEEDDNNNNNSKKNRNSNVLIVKSSSSSNFNAKSRSNEFQTISSSSGGNTLSQRATEFKLNSVAAIAVDSLGRVLVADKLQFKVFAVEPDVPELNENDEFEIQSPSDDSELLVFNKYGLHIATRDNNNYLQSQQQQQTKLSFAYTHNTSYGLLTSISFSNGNKLSISREGPAHSARVIETAFGGLCKLEFTRTGQVSTVLLTSSSSSSSSSLLARSSNLAAKQQAAATSTTKLTFAYKSNESGLLKQARNEISGELFELSYDEFGRSSRISYSNSSSNSNSNQLQQATVDCFVSNEPEKFFALNKMSEQSKRKFSQLNSSGKCAQLVVTSTN